MKSIIEYLTESKQHFLIKGHTTSQKVVIPEIPDLKHHNDTAIKPVINSLDKFAKSKGFRKVIFKNHIDGPTGDFTIFVYKPNEKRYCVGFDGSWDSKDLTFKHCIEQTYDYIIKKKM